MPFMLLYYFVNLNKLFRKFLVDKGQLISKAIYGLVTSPKKRTDEFVLLSFFLFKANKSNSSICFLGESTARQFAFRFYLTFKLSDLPQAISCSKDVLILG